jgi:AcrR family transcriptional regulator
MSPEPALDPRIRRTRQMLFTALEELLHEKSFDEITMLDLAARSTLNRGTIYTHFKDKYALLAALVEEKFRAIFDARMKGASGTCHESVKQLILTVCDYLGPMMALQPGAPAAVRADRRIHGAYDRAELSSRRFAPEQTGNVVRGCRAAGDGGKLGHLRHRGGVEPHPRDLG